MSEINWPELRKWLPMVSEERDQALLMVASNVLATTDNLRLSWATELAPGWISSQMGAWRSSYVLLGDAIERTVALKRFPELAAIFAGLDAGAFNVATKTVAPKVASKPAAVAPVAESVPEEKPERELAMSEACKRTPGCPKPANHIGGCPGMKTGKPTVSAVPVAAQKQQAVAIVQSAPIVSNNKPATLIAGRITIQFTPDDSNAPDFKTSFATQLPMSAMHEFVSQFDYKENA